MFPKNLLIENNSSLVMEQNYVGSAHVSNIVICCDVSNLEAVNLSTNYYSVDRNAYHIV